MAEVEATRLAPSDDGSYPDGYTEEGAFYWQMRGIWCLSLPGGDMANLSAHTVTEHDDGAITVSPSIKITIPHEHRIRHGFLRRGVWEPCGDDQPLAPTTEAPDAP